MEVVPSNTSTPDYVDAFRSAVQRCLPGRPSLAQKAPSVEKALRNKIKSLNLPPRQKFTHAAGAQPVVMKIMARNPEVGVLQLSPLHVFRPAIRYTASLDVFYDIQCSKSFLYTLREPLHMPSPLFFEYSLQHLNDLQQARSPAVYAVDHWKLKNHGSVCRRVYAVVDSAKYGSNYVHTIATKVATGALLADHAPFPMSVLEVTVQTTSKPQFKLKFGPINGNAPSEDVAEQFYYSAALYALWVNMFGARGGVSSHDPYSIVLSSKCRVDFEEVTELSGPYNNHHSAEGPQFPTSTTAAHMEGVSPPSATLSGSRSSSLSDSGSCSPHTPLSGSSSISAGNSSVDSVDRSIHLPSIRDMVMLVHPNETPSDPSPDTRIPRIPTGQAFADAFERMLKSK